MEISSFKRVQMNIFTKLKWSHKYKRQIYGYQGRKERDKLGDWN